MTDIIRHTHLLGVFSLLIAATATVFRRRRGWVTISIFLTGMAVDIATDFSWIIHDWIRGKLITAHFYDNHIAFQLSITGAVMALILPAVLVVIRLKHSATRWTSIVTIALIVLFCVQAISVHGVDVVLGSPLGPFLVIGWLWFICAIIIVILALTSKRR